MFQPTSGVRAKSAREVIPTAAMITISGALWLAPHASARPDYSLEPGAPSCERQQNMIISFFEKSKDGKKGRRMDR